MGSGNWFGNLFNWWVGSIIMGFWQWIGQILGIFGLWQTPLDAVIEFLPDWQPPEMGNTYQNSMKLYNS